MAASATRAEDTDQTWRDGFGSDHAHMRRTDDGCQQPPLPWQAPGGQAITLAAAITQLRAGLDMMATTASLA